MRFIDAVLLLGLIAEIHGTDRAVAEAAKRFSKQLPRRYRQYMFDVMNSPSPLRHVRLFITTLPDDLFDQPDQTNGED
ncbi:hypothetical protein EAW52_25790 [Pseudomonas sp. LTJR-52]|uniref:DUF7740 domain-containing protein n=1 Tax=Pseudomonas sp. LTJR-52 TaxID=2479392 RepID=UPI000EFD2A8F|nr:hypothetical protein [Pseudomonas sp. LTJR-52]AYN97087.1 hypothetical protein EAW52_25790 [Pseudomonas sp. LTJR-52]